MGEAKETRASWAARHREKATAGRPRPRRVDAGYKVRYFVAAELVESLYRGWRTTRWQGIESILRADWSSVRNRVRPLDDTGAQLFFRFVAAAYERRSLPSPAIGFEDWGHFLPNETSRLAAGPACHHSIVVVTTASRSYARSPERRGQEGVQMKPLSTVA